MTDRERKLWLLLGAAIALAFSAPGIRALIAGGAWGYTEIRGVR